MDIQVIEQKMGSGPAAAVYDEVSITFKIWTYDPNKPDGKSTLIEDVSPAHPLVLSLGANKVFPDFEKTLIGMKAGGKRVILLPPSSAYGKMNINPSVKPSTPLLIEAELLTVKRKKK